MPTYVPHISMNCLGTLPGGEIFNFGLSLGQQDYANGPGLDLAPNNTVWEDAAADAATFFQNNYINRYAVLQSVKFAHIGSDGKYAAPPVEIPVGAPNGIAGGNLTIQHPNQIALACTLHTDADLGRVKGRFYVPMPANPVAADGRISESDRDGWEGMVATFVNNLNNQPGFDVLNIRVVVASSGRRNSDGSVKLPPANHLVTAVSVGRTLDTVRRRRNKVGELRGTPTAVS